MKAMVDGVWRTDVLPTPGYRDAAERSRFRGRVRAGGGSDFEPVPGRYHLYVSYACPFAHRTLLGRALLGLEETIAVSVLDPDWGGPTGWVFGAPPMATPDHVSGLASLPEVYRKADPRFTGKVTVPALWDKARSTIVNNESADILRMLEVEFRGLGNDLDLYPDALGAEIDRINAFVGPRINGGVYRAGFASTQEAYDAAVIDLFAALDELEEHLETREFLVGGRLSEADLRLFPTLVRFDVAYYGALRCNLKRLADYPHLLAYTRRIYALPGVAGTIRLDHVKRHYWDDHEMINRRILPIGPGSTSIRSRRSPRDPVGHGPGRAGRRLAPALTGRSPRPAIVPANFGGTPCWVSLPGSRPPRSPRPTSTVLPLPARSWRAWGWWPSGCSRSCRPPSMASRCSGR